MSTVRRIAAGRGGRAVSPAFLVAALICFLFTFTGVSCNVSLAKQTLNGASQLSGGGSGGQSQALNACLNALQGEDLAQYSGVTYVAGGSPSVVGSAPAACRVGQQGLPGGGSLGSASSIGIGVQPLPLVAAIAIVAGIVTGVLTLLRLRRPLLQSGVVTALALAALLLLVVGQSRADDAILARLDAAATGGSAPFSVRDYFDVHPALAYWLALAFLAVAAVASAAAGVLRAPPETPTAEAAQEATAAAPT